MPHRRYSKLETSAAFKAILQDSNLSSTRPILDDELKAAIESLKASTTAIDSQTEALRRQCKELKSKIQEASQIKQQRSKSTGRLLAGHTAEKQQVDLTVLICPIFSFVVNLQTNITSQVEDLIQELEERFQGAQKDLIADQSKLLPAISTLLREHDVVLRSMEKLASSSEQAEESNMLRKRVDELSALLAKYTAEEINHRLNRVFQKSVTSDTSTRNEVCDIPEQIESVQAELNSLYPEVSILAELAARQQFQKPISGIFEEWQEHSQFATEEQLQHVCHCSSVLGIQRTNNRIRFLRLW